MDDNQTARFSIFFNRLPGLWWIVGETLIHWVTHRELKFFPGKVGIAVTINREGFNNYCANRGVILNDEKDVVNMGYVKINVQFKARPDDLVVASPQDKERLKRRSDLRDNGVWTVNIDPIKPHTIQIPFKLGTILDKYKPLWWKDNDHSNFTSNAPKWFTPERKQSGYELLQAMYDCAERAGIRDAMWLSFGNLLGYVTVGDFLAHDNDLDVCIDTEKCTPEQCNKYLEEVKKPMTLNGTHFPHGLTEKMYRQSSKRDDTGCPLWASVGPRSVMHDNGVKSCNWFMFNHSGYSFHSKGNEWVQPGKFKEIQFSRQNRAIALGIPSDIISQFTETDFHGVAVNIPNKAGSVLDFFYSGWCSLGQRGTSERKVILVVPDWNRKQTWRMS